MHQERPFDPDGVPCEVEVTVMDREGFPKAERGAGQREEER